MSKVRFLAEIVGQVTGFGCLFYTASCMVFPTEITGVSMSPTIKPKEWALVAAANSNWVDRGNVIILWSPTTKNERIIKRLIAKEGDVVQPRAGAYTEEPIVVPKGHLWIEGDNGDRSIDSNTYGPVPVSLVTGVALSIISPPWSPRTLTPMFSKPIFAHDRVTLASGSEPSHLKKVDIGAHISASAKDDLD